jgi:glycosyltransferase involved in cell wall biosynthesis
MTSPRLALFIPSLGGGGAERSFVHLAHAFTEAGYQVDMLTAKGDGPLRGLVDNRVALVDFARPTVSSCLLPLARYIRQARPRALIAAMDHCNVIALLANAIAGCKTHITCTLHNVMAAAPAANRKERLLRRLLKPFYLRTDALVAVSHGVADDNAAFIGLPRDRVQVIYNPVITRELHSRAADLPAIELPRSPLVVAMGRLTRQKDFRTLLHAFPHVHSATKASLIILGEGPERAELESLSAQLGLQDVVRMPGFVTNPYPILKAADLFVLSSRWEGLGNVLVEALALGCPVVTTDCESGPSEIVAGGRYGRLVDVGAAGSLAEAMVAELTDRSAQAPAEWLGQFSAEYVASRYAQLWEGR